MNQHKTKNPKVELVVVISIGAVMFIAALVVLLVVYRPFVPWVKIKCYEEAGTYIELNDKDVKYIYEVNGVKYEKVLYNVPHGASNHDSQRIRTIIYVNANNPNEVRPGHLGRKEILIFLIGFIILGIILIFFEINQYKNKIKKQ